MLLNITERFWQASCSRYQLLGNMLRACPRNYNPVCGTDSMTYPNECFLCREISRNQGIDKKHDGVCLKADCTDYLRISSGRVIPCSMEYIPVCGTNGITYRNKCQFCNAVANGLNINLAKVGVCLQPDETQQNNQVDCSDHKDSNLTCPLHYSPLCGSDGKTYQNECHFCNAVVQNQGSLFLRYRGSCSTLELYPSP
nr:PREDICTED: double-headed protease inhibitor, submandibular gland-like [Opisthocomus hoazin]